MKSLNNEIFCQGEAMQPKDVKKTLSNYILADGMDLIFDLEKSKGPYFVDQKNGKPYLDFFCFFATQAIGYNHPKLKEKSFLEKLERSSRVKLTLSDVYCPEYAEFVQTFAENCSKKYFAHNFFISGGALAIENALKTAFDWKVRTNLAKNRGEQGYKIIHFKEAFHGRSGYTLSMTNTSDPKKHMYFAKFDWPRITSPKCFFPLEGDNLQKTQKLEEQALDEINVTIRKQKDDIAAIMIEPIQSEGGDNHFRKEFMKEIRRICDENEILMLMDEVQTGCGTTGKWWGFEHFDIVPDGIAFAKKFLTGGICFTSRIDDIKDNVFNVSSRINSTFGGNIVDMVRAKQIIDIIVEENLIDNSKDVGGYLLDKLREVNNNFPQKISNVRGRGLLVAFDVKDAQTRDKFINTAKDEGLLLIACGERSVRARPMLDIKKEHVDEAISVISKVCDII